MTLKILNNNASPSNWSLSSISFYSLQPSLFRFYKGSSFQWLITVTRWHCYLAQKVSDFLRRYPCKIRTLKGSFLIFFQSDMMFYRNKLINGTASVLLCSRDHLSQHETNQSTLGVRATRNISSSSNPTNWRRKTHRHVCVGTTHHTCVLVGLQYYYYP